MSLPFLSVFDVLFAVFLALFPQATNLVHLNHMHSDGGGWGDEEEEKRRKREREVGGGVEGGTCTMCIIGHTNWAYCNSTK